MILKNSMIPMKGDELYCIQSTKLWRPGFLGVSEYTLPEPLVLSCGDHVSLKGDCGTGKSLWLSLLKGLEEDFGISLSNPPHFSRDNKKPYPSVTLLPQEPDDALMFISVKEELQAGIDFKETPEALRLLNHVIDQLDLSLLLDRMVRSLSSGQKRRLSLALAALRPSCVLLLDEPLSHLDHACKKTVQAMITRWSQEKELIIQSEHSQSTPLGFSAYHFVAHNEERRASLLKGEPPSTNLVLKKPLLKIPEKQNPLITLKNLRFSFSDSLFDSLFEDVNATFFDNEIVHIQGENGSGKSTLLALIRGIKKSAKHEIQHHKKLRLALLQADSFHHLIAKSAWDVVHHRASWMPDTCARDIPPLRASGGQQRQLAMHSLLSPSADVYLLDEPDIGLDLLALQKLCDLLCDLRDQGKLILICSHHDAFAQSLSPTRYRLHAKGLTHVT